LKTINAPLKHFNTSKNVKTKVEDKFET